MILSITLVGCDGEHLAPVYIAENPCLAFFGMPIRKNVLRDNSYIVPEKGRDMGSSET